MEMREYADAVATYLKALSMFRKLGSPWVKPKLSMAAHWPITELVTILQLLTA
jgi:hypothetical protein